MELTNAFEIDVPPDRAWEVLMDMPRVVACMPGAELREELGGDRWRALIRVKLGPMAMAFDTDVHREQVDVDGRRVRLVTRAQEAKGRGQARATISSSLSAVDGARTRVDVVTELALSGRIAQFGRGAVQGVAEELVARFTHNVGELANGHAAEERAGAPAGGLAILLAALRRALRRLLPRRGAGS